MRFFIGILLLLSVPFQLFSQQKTIDFGDFLQKGTFVSHTVKGIKPMKDGEHFAQALDGKKIIKYNYKTGEAIETIFDVQQIKDSKMLDFSDFELSKDETKILFTTNMKRIYRRSFTATCYVWNKVTKELLPVSDKGDQQGATMSPDGERVAFVRDNNIYIKNLKFGSESQATFDGVKNKIINGIPDWVYEEEFGFNKAVWWSPDSKFLAYIRFDETNVPEYHLTFFAGEKPEYPEYALYPGEKVYKYPKAGEKNSQVSVRIYEIRSKATITADLGKETDIYVPRLIWTPSANDLAIMKVNRRQNRLELMYANPFTGDTRVVFTEKNEKYIEDNYYDAFCFLDDGKFVVLSEKSGWSHLYLNDKNGNEIMPLTTGNFDVTAFYGFDSAKKIYYYQAAAESPLRREIYFVSADLKKKGKLSQQTGTNKAEFGQGFKYFIQYFSSKDIPEMVTVNDISGKQIRTLEDNAALRNKIGQFTLPVKEFFTFKTPEGIELNGYMIKPLDFEASKKYPVLITQYSGPNSQQVTDSWGRGPGWNEFLASKGLLVVCVDPRGTGCRGENFRKSTYLQMGKYESDDMIETAKYLGSLPYVNKSKISIFGWSYGGFMTCLTLAKAGTLFYSGIAVAPVTNWRFYDSVYTERYMRMPKENPDGYDENSPIKLASGIKGKLLIIHGLADDNVHAQNTFEFTEKMVQQGVPFDMAIYTNRDHGISGGNTSVHLYRKMTDFLLNMN